jgi:hypothetical protein
MATNINYEQIYQLTFHKQWSELLELVYQCSKVASSDELVMRAVKTFENEFFGELDKGVTIANIETVLEKLFLLDKGRIYKLAEERSVRVVVELINIYIEEKDCKRKHMSMLNFTLVMKYVPKLLVFTKNHYPRL